MVGVKLIAKMFKQSYLEYRSLEQIALNANLTWITLNKKTLQTRILRYFAYLNAGMLWLRIL